ncbi:MAG: tetratricopeptide repeat protein [Devosiaceae bacterium]|nr:tetratricopeptide repeat protein [Devosiaceae bacterium MH13]
MTDIFSEIEEDIRKDRAKRMWDRFGKYIIGGALALVLAVAGWRGYEAYNTGQAQQAGDRFLDAIAQLEASPEAGFEALETVIETGPDGYAELARFRAASATAEAGDSDGAITSFQAIVDDASVTPIIRDVARVRLGYLLLDTGDASQIEGLLLPLSEPTHAFSHSAREVRAFAAMKAGNQAQALALFQELVADFSSPEPIRSRARVALDVLASEGAAALDS